jgi:hypothetical protein
VYYTILSGDAGTARVYPWCMLIQKLTHFNARPFSPPPNLAGGPSHVQLSLHITSLSIHFLLNKWLASSQHCIDSIATPPAVPDTRKKEAARPQMGCGANFIFWSGSSIAAHTLHYSRDRTGVNKSRVSMENNLIRQSGRASLAQLMIGASAYCIKKYGRRRPKKHFRSNFSW